MVKYKVGAYTITNGGADVANQNMAKRADVYVPRGGWLCIC